MATFSRVTPTGWLQGSDSSSVSRVTPTGWQQLSSSAAPAPTGTIAATQAPNTASIVASRSSDIIAAQAKNVSSIAGSVTITGTAVATQAPNIAIIAGSNTTSASITSLPMKNNEGTVLSGEVGVIANIYNPTTGALVLHKTGLTSDGNGVVVISDPVLSAGTTYAYEIVLAANGRRLPVATAA